MRRFWAAFTPNKRDMQPPPAHSRLEWLDGLRAIAILAVVIVHGRNVTPYTPSLLAHVMEFGQYGVQLFFVISTITIVRTLDRSEKIGEWYLKRFLRIAPIYYTGIVLYFPLHYVEHRYGSRGAEGLSLVDVISNIFFAHGWAPSANNSVVPGGWSIAVEMSFYCIAPALYAAMRKTNRSAFAALTAIAATVMLIFSSLIARGPIANNSFLYYWPPTQIPIFLIGFSLYALLHDRLNETGRSYLLMTAGLLSFALGGYLGVGKNISHLTAPTFIATGLWLILLGLGGWREVLSRPTLTFIGRISYSLYVSHFAVEKVIEVLAKRYTRGMDQLAVSIAGTALLIALSILAAYVMHKLIEVPAARLSTKIIERMRSRRNSPGYGFN